MLKSVEFSGASENPYKVQLVRPDPFGLTIKGIDGLGAGKAELHTSERASLDGNVFNGARLGSRNIVFNLGFGSRLDPEAGREISYEVFPLKERVTMEFETDTKKVLIHGNVESNEPDIFTNEPGLDISILCVENPYFQSVPEDQVRTRLYWLEDKLKFPLSNESTANRLINMGEYHLDDYAEIRYQGTVRTGVLIRFIFTDSGNNPAIMNERTGQTMRIDTDIVTTVTGEPVVAGDVIEINTIRGSKSVTLIRRGVRVNVINALSRSSQWIELLPGINPVSVFTASGSLPFQTEIVHDKLYQGL